MGTLKLNAHRPLILELTIKELKSYEKILYTNIRVTQKTARQITEGCKAK